MFVGNVLSIRAACLGCPEAADYCAARGLDHALFQKLAQGDWRGLGATVYMRPVRLNRGGANEALPSVAISKCEPLTPRLGKVGLWVIQRFGKAVRRQPRCNEGACDGPHPEPASANHQAFSMLKRGHCHSSETVAYSTVWWNQ
jgi:hypothetical protein